MNTLVGENEDNPILGTDLGLVKTFHCHHNPMITDEDTGIIKQVKHILFALGKPHSI